MKHKIIAIDRNRILLDVRRILYGKNIELEERVTQFISFACDQIMPVSMTLIQEQTRMTAELLQI